jgi:hypothetical protein
MNYNQYDYAKVQEKQRFLRLIDKNMKELEELEESGAEAPTAIQALEGLRLEIEND